MHESEVIIINNRESEYVNAITDTTSSAIVIDMIRLPEPIRQRSNYVGINW
jgi:GDP-mannose 6-dehydrogenase